MKEETKLWVDKAEEDFDNALYNFRGHRYGITAFLCQQALEKIIKAVIVEVVNKRPAKSHDLIKLAKDANLTDKMPKKWLPELRSLTQYYFLVRYPDIGKKFFTTPKIAKEVLGLLKEIYPWVKGRLKK